MFLLRHLKQMLCSEKSDGGKKQCKKPSVVRLCVDTEKIQDFAEIAETFRNVREVRFAIRKEGGDYSLELSSENDQVVLPPNCTYEGEFQGSSIHQKLCEFMKSEDTDELSFRGKYVSASLVLSFEPLEE